jgi:chitin synthase
VIFWCFLMVYLTFAAVFVTVKSIQAEVADKDFSFSTIFKNSQFFSMIVSLLSTYVLWIVASILFFDPWHMLTCFVQYIVLTPTYINVLNIYAFCNTHDITWGTKGDDKAEKLPSANVKADGKIDVLIPQDDGDLNALYESELQKFSVKAPKEVNKVSDAERQEDYYKGFRSTVVLVWIFCNFALAAVVLSAAGVNRIEVKQNEDTLDNKTTIYMAVVLWSVAVLSLFRFIGAIWFLVVRMVNAPTCIRLSGRLLTMELVSRRLIGIPSHHFIRALISFCMASRSRATWNGCFWIARFCWRLVCLRRRDGGFLLVLRCTFCEGTSRV